MDVHHLKKKSRHPRTTRYSPSEVCTLLSSSLASPLTPSSTSNQTNNSSSLTTMAACTDYSRNHDFSSSISLLRCCRAAVCSNPYTKTGMNSSKVCPQKWNDDIWWQIRQEAESDSKQEPLLYNLYHCTILSHTSLESALSYHLGLKLCTPHVSSAALAATFLKALFQVAAMGRAVRDDLRAVKERDPACISLVNCFLNFKGFLACQAHRLAHHFWINGRTALALMIQSRVSEVFGVDIHPAAVIGSGIVIDHATGVVIGETTAVGNEVTILHNVTLGGTGKCGGERHPKIRDGVVIGAGAKILGNIEVGRNAKIGAGAVVLKEVPAGATAVGNPARLIGLGLRP